MIDLIKMLDLLETLFL